MAAFVTDVPVLGTSTNAKDCATVLDTPQALVWAIVNLIHDRGTSKILPRENGLLSAVRAEGYIRFLRSTRPANRDQRQCGACHNRRNIF
jgi:hypothetical protein